MKAYIGLTSFANNKKAMELLSSITNEVVVRTETNRPNKDELISLVASYDILIIGIKEKMDEDVFEASTQLKYLCTLSIGTDHIDEAFFNSDAIKVVACTNANVHTVAEFVFAYVLSDMKSFNECNTAFINRTGRDGIKNMPSEMSSKTVGVIGAGRIATKFFEITNSLSYTKLCWTFNPEQHQDLSSSYGVKFADLQSIFTDSDYILIIIPASDKTEGLVSSALLSSARQTAKIINISRMNIVDIPAFINAVGGGKFEGSLIDCFSEEISDEQLSQLNGKVTLSPHVAGISVESRKRMSGEIAEKLVKEVR
jgi:phosphoglycerate dehydrogenase-like enzyme